MLYASELFATVEHQIRQTGKEYAPDDLPNIIAEILVYFVRERLLRGLTQSYLPREADLPRVRGRVDALRTTGHQLLDRGIVACRFHEPTLNTPRNRLIKAALDRGAYLASGHVAKRCRDYAALMFRMGVVGELPDRNTLSKEVNTINNQGDRQALAAAKLLLDMAIPDCRAGREHLLLPEASESWLRNLFEKAVRGFYRVTASDLWSVGKTNKSQNWPVQDDAEELVHYLPRMELDTVLISKDLQQKIVIDTKFTSLLKSGWYRTESLSSAYIYQMYAYLRTQEAESPADRYATGILLHPAMGKSRRFSCEMQGHKFIFAAVNLNAPAQDIRAELLNLLPM
jgi:5-methylcytosine-specific restriction enzyme subunit McrC